MVGRRGLRRAGFAIGTAAALLAAPVRAEDSVCPAVWPPRAPVSRPITLDAGALLRLRGIGNLETGLGGASPLAISPDGRKVAFFVAQAVSEVNDVCETLVVLDLAHPSDARAIDSGGVGIRIEEVLRGVRRPSGFFDVNVPLWSPDGRSLIYRKRVGGHTQVWRAVLDGSPARQLSRAEQDFEAIGLTSDGERVLYIIRPGRAEFARARAVEARTGYLYDARVLPHLAPAPQLPADLPEAVMALPVEGGAATPASPADESAFARPVPLGSFANGPVAGPSGAIAGTEAVSSSFFAPRKVWMKQADRTKLACSDPACAGTVPGVWWHGGEIMFLIREGWHHETSVIRAWSPNGSTVRSIVRTNEWISGCAGGPADAVVCLVEDSRQPVRIVAFDAATGRRRVLFDPNPEIAPWRLPRVERLRWRNSVGLEAWGDLVIPDGEPPAGGWPLVVVQYSSEGFLRGGTGNEYPIFPLAERGIAVLSFQRPQLVASLHPDISDVTDVIAVGNRDWADRRSVLDSLMKGIDLALAREDIDPDRIGISGLSDGSTTTRFALINANRFAAAAISSCCLEPHSMMTDGGIAQADWFRSTGYPGASEYDPAFWLPASMAMNAEKMDTPLLMQLADDEYIQALETFTALREHGKPVEMYVFPGEHHNKWQPLHRAAVYERNLDWFSFWLQGVVDPDAAKADQYRRWQAMRPRAVPGSAP
jgi:hypothetical protein